MSTAIKGIGFDHTEGGFAAIKIGDRQFNKAELLKLLYPDEKPKGVYLHVFHGRDTVEQDMEDWGYDGPVIGPLNYVHTTYQCDVKFACSPEVARKFFTDEEVYSFEGDLIEGRIVLKEGLLPLGGKFYGDWSVFGPECVNVADDGAPVAL